MEQEAKIISEVQESVKKLEESNKKLEQEAKIISEVQESVKKLEESNKNIDDLKSQAILASEHLDRAIDSHEELQEIAISQPPVNGVWLINNRMAGFARHLAFLRNQFINPNNNNSNQVSRETIYNAIMSENKVNFSRQTDIFVKKVRGNFDQELADSAQTVEDLHAEQVAASSRVLGQIKQAKEIENKLNDRIADLNQINNQDRSNTESIIDTYANPNDVMPSHTDPED